MRGCIKKTNGEVYPNPEESENERFLKSLCPQFVTQADGKELELPSYSSGNTGVADQDGAKSGALCGNSLDGGALLAPTDPDLMAVVDAWPTLSPADRMNILEIIRREGQA